MLPLQDITSADWRKFIAANNLPQLGSGISRTAWALNDDYVIKLVTGGVGQHQSEVARWKSATRSERKYLATIAASGADWSVMERAKETLFDRFGWQYSRLGDAASDRLSTRTGHGDLHAANIGYFPRARVKYKVIDYGS